MAKGRGSNKDWILIFEVYFSGLYECWWCVPNICRRLLCRVHRLCGAWCFVASMERKTNKSSTRLTRISLEIPVIFMKNIYIYIYIYIYMKWTMLHVLIHLLPKPKNFHHVSRQIKWNYKLLRKNASSTPRNILNEVSSCVSSANSLKHISLIHCY